MKNLTDPDVLTRWIASDREAFAVLAVRHHAFVAAACRRQGPSAAVDDCVLAVFLLLMRKPRAAARAPAHVAWLQRVADFVCRTARRGAERRKRTRDVRCQESASVPRPSRPLFAIPAVPTPGAESLATGALHTMTISSLTPLATAAGLFLTAGLLTVTFAAEPSTGPSVKSSTPAGAVVLAPALQKALATTVSCSFEDAPMKDLATWLGSQSTAIVLDPKVLASDRRIAITLGKMPLKDALMMIEMMAGLSHTIVDGKTYRIELPKP